MVIFNGQTGRVTLPHASAGNMLAIDNSPASGSVQHLEFLRKDCCGAGRIPVRSTCQVNLSGTLKKWL